MSPPIQKEPVHTLNEMSLLHSNFDAFSISPPNPFNGLPMEVLEKIMGFSIGTIEVDFMAPDNYKRIELPQFREKLKKIRLSCRSMNFAADWFKRSFIMSPIFGPFNPKHTILTSRVDNFHNDVIHLAGRMPHERVWRSLISNPIHRQNIHFLRVEIKSFDDQMKKDWKHDTKRRGLCGKSRILIKFASQFRKLEEVNIDLVMKQSEMLHALPWIEASLPQWEKDLKNYMPIVFHETGTQRKWRFPKLTLTWNGGALPERRDELEEGVNEEIEGN